MSSSLSPIFYLFIIPAGVLYQKVQHLISEDETLEGNHPPIMKYHCPGPKHPKYGIPTEHWQTITHRVMENNEPLRAVAQEYGVSHETTRRIILHFQQQREQQEGYLYSYCSNDIGAQ